MIGDWASAVVLSGSLLLALPIAAVVGLLSFFSPCCLPLVPDYLSLITGATGADHLSDTRQQGRPASIAAAEPATDCDGRRRAVLVATRSRAATGVVTGRVRPGGMR